MVTSRIAGLLLVLAGPLSAAAGERISWQRDVRPLLARRCLACHGPDDSRREAGLRLDRPEQLLGRRDGPPLLTAGRPERSELWRRVSSDDPEVRMPPAPDHPPLTAVELQVIRQWIADGAELAPHWSHQPIRHRPPPPTSDSAWPRNAIDAIVLDELRRRGEPPPPIASCETLARRLALTLTGLPPSPETARLLTGTSPREIARYVDRLLASPAYGEHMAVAWLDLARYADTHGYHIDGRRDMWRWRDWVIESLNADMPFDQFTIEQLAGDLLPGASMRQRLATGLLRNNMINSEDGAIAEEFLAEYAAERTTAVGAIWLGQTLQCCRCHDHKNDPWEQEDFYRLAAFFNDLPEKGIDGRKGNAAPLMPAPTRRQQQRWRELRDEAAEARRLLADRMAAPRDAAQTAWESRALAAGPRPAPAPLLRLELDDAQGRRAAEAGDGPAARLQGDVSWLPAGRDKGAAVMSGRGRIFWRLPPQEEFTVGCWVFLTTKDPMRLMSLGSPPLQLQLDRQGLRLLEGDRPVASAPPRVPLKLRKWQHVAWKFRDRRHTIYLNGVGALSWREPEDEGARTGDERGRADIELPLWIGGPPGQQQPAGGLRGMVDQVRAYGRGLSPQEAARLAEADPLQEALGVPRDARSPSQRELVRREFLLATDPQFAERAAVAERLSAQARRLEDEFPTAMVMRTGPPRTTHLLERGDYRREGAVVRRGVPSWLPPLDAAGEPTRLDLARWLVSADHPLTPRVVANRVWQAHFPAPLAPTADDLGLGGVAPQHGELLDFLAGELLASGWDLKHMHRLVVTSATFLQPSPRLPGEPLESRPLPAEVLRDSALAVGGLLVREQGGPSVFPYQPAGLWEELARDPNLYSAQIYHEDDGAGLYRRSLYNFWKRSSPPPTLQLLGAPSREVCVAMRKPAAGSQQALVLMNDPTFVESARALAERILSPEGDDRRRIAEGVRRVLLRPPSEQELRRLSSLLEALRRHYRGHAPAAEALLQVGRSGRDPQLPAAELAAWTAWCNTLLNTHEFQTTP